MPDWFAPITQLPAVKADTVLPATVQTSGVVEVNDTVLPDAPPVALTVPVPPTKSEGAKPKLTLCEPAPTAIVCVACGAAV